ncbi:MAG TPA: hypothetical protein GXX63_02250 [Tissierellia bacterium]|nr:hypothetical protein [Tissierellia bacterium]
MVDFNSNIFNARLIANMENVSVADVITTAPLERTGYSARFAPVQAGTVKDYTGTVEWDKASVTPIDLTLNQRKYFAFGLDDLERVQTNPQEVDKVTAKQGRGLAEICDTFVLNQIATNAGNKIGNTTTKEQITKPSDAYELLVDMNTKLSQKKAPRADRYAVINNEFLALLEKDDRFTRNAEILANGIVEGSNVNGMKIIVSEELPSNKILAVQKEATGFAKFIDETEAMRLESAFAYGIRGLNVYDAKMLEKDYAVVAYYEIVTDTAA